MSGGVDSAVAAARLVDAGYEVVGVTFHLWDYPDDQPEKSRCCAPEDAHDARLVADHLGIPHYTFDRREMFDAQVVKPFVDAYLGGATPSPCVWCNRSVKMRELFGLADRLGASHVATGHYARIVGAGEQTQLLRARDRRKDQSYFLHMLRADELARVLLPLGDDDKETIRADAIARDLPGATKGESQELCFVSQKSYADFVEDRADGRVRPGPIVDEGGKVVGSHDGVHRFTVGQRRGLGVALGRPAFVQRIEGDRVVVASAGKTGSTGAKLDAGAWAADVTFPLRARVKVRARHEPVPAEIDDGGHRVRFAAPVRAVAPGQYAVAYDGERVLGGATIVSALTEGAEGAA